MGQKDLVTNKCLSDNERYSDLINGIVFGGEQKLCCEDLQEVDSRNVISQWLYKYGDKGRPLYRDIIKKAAFGINFAVIGIENQSQVHYLMPLRIMSYDAAEYERQAAKVRKKIRRNRGITSAEFVSGFGKNTNLYPCITIVLFYGKEWDGSRELHELLDFTDIPKELREYVNNYKVHIVNVAELNAEVFRTDLKQIFRFLQCANDKKKIKELTEKDSAYRTLGEDAYDMMVEYSESFILKGIKKCYGEGGKVDMCKGLQDWAEEERTIGREEGIEQGIEQGIRAFVQDKIEDEVSEEVIIAKLVLRFSINEEKARDYYRRYH